MKKMKKRGESDSEPGHVDGASPIPERIRNRRNLLGMTGAELAKRIGVSPSYISLIESGAKIPSPSVAEKIARALRDSPDLYQAWVISARQGGWRTALRQSRVWNTYSTDPTSLERVASGEDVADLESTDADYALADEAAAEELIDFAPAHLEESSAKSVQTAPPEEARRSIGGAIGELFRRKARPEEAPRGFTLLEIPVLEDGADPGDRDEVDESQTVDTLFLDSRLFGRAALRRPFAYRPGDLALRRIGERIRPGDHVVLSSGVPQLRPETIVAVRFRREVVLARALLKKTALLLLPAAGARDFDVIELDDPEQLPSLVVGHVVLTVRAW
jgi:transcriptional regulator with XRE-family HTH domain